MNGLNLSINLSGKQLLITTLVDSVVGILKDTGLDPHKLTLEVTESTLIVDQSVVFEKFEAFRKLGIAISVDDFGTGYSTLFNLSNYNLDEIKIDNVFAEDVHRNPKTYEICKSMIYMAKRLAIRTVIEGIEENQQLELFRTLGCERGQGYYLAKPMTACEIEQLFFIKHVLQISNQS
jgi:EAL domain-containing protein (putative c-di-GMP-specific phosphodiesterase class I)